MQNSIIIACRNNSEANKIQEICQFQTASVYFESAGVLSRLADMPKAVLVMTSLLQDETSIGLTTKVSITTPTFTVIWAKYAAKNQNILRLLGCGAMRIIGPDEEELLPDILSRAEDMLEDMVFPAFFVDDDVSNLKTPDKSIAKRLHISFLGSQAMMSCANAILNIKASESISMAAVAPLSPWCKDRLIHNFAEYTLWKSTYSPTIITGGVTLCQNLAMLCSLEPTVQHYIICHGSLSYEEREYLSRLPETTRVFTARADGYSDWHSNEPSIPPEKFWDVLISALY